MTKITATGRDYGSPVEYEYVYHERSPNRWAQQNGKFFLGNFNGWKQVNLMLGFKPEDVAALGLALRLALAIALPPVLMLFLGQYLGRIFGRDAIFIAVSVLVGLYIGFRQAIRLLLKK
jgi:hypothetical protein